MLYNKILSSGFIANYLVLKTENLCPYFITDRASLKAHFFFEFHRKLNLNNPKTFNEKLQWMKLYYRNSVMTQMVDKYEAKEYVSQRIGSDYIIPTLGVWDTFDDIDFDSLPNEFVLKTTHDSGNVIVVKNKKNFSTENAKHVLSKSLKTDYYIKGREWPYKNVRRRILAEQYMEDESGELRDYKFFCFDGKVKCLYMATDRFKPDEDTKFDFFDEDFNHLPITNGHPNSDSVFQKPKGFEDMKKIAEKLSMGFSHLRVDLYSINGKIYFGELTFFHESGMLPFVPEEWDYKMGEWLHLPLK